MQYFIDPQRGSDENAGTSSDAAWQCFARLEQQLLSPGDHIEIAPGVFEHRLTLTGSGTPELPIHVHFAPGRYDFFPDDARREVYNISNCNDGVDQPKAIAILLRQARHMLITGPGARIVCRGKMIELCIDHAEDITVSDLDFDYHRPTVSEFSVRAVGDAYADLEVHADSTYSINDGQILWQGEGWDFTTGLAQELIPATGEIWRRKDPLKDLRIEELSAFRLRAHGTHDMVAGRVYQVRDTFRDCAGVFMRRSKDILLQTVNFYFLHGMGILCQYTENITLDRVRIAPEEGRGRTCSAWADCTHFSGCRGQIALRNCVFDGAHDDAVNIHGTYLQIQEIASDRCMRLRFAHRQTYGFMAVNPADVIDFVRWDSLEIYGTCRISEVEMLLDAYELLVTLEEPVPNGVRVKDVIENVTWTPAVEICGCTAKRIPTRGFLLTTRQPIVVRANSFHRLRTGIHISSDAGSWFESGCVRDVSITGNRFLNCRRAAVYVKPECQKRNDSVHCNVKLIENDVIVPENGLVLEATSTDGLSVRANRIQTAVESDPADLFRVDDCSRVHIEENMYRVLPRT